MWRLRANPAILFLLLNRQGSNILVFSTKRAAAMMTKDTRNDDGSPKFGKLLIVLVGAVVFCGILTWVMGTYFPNFPS